MLGDIFCEGRDRGKSCHATSAVKDFVKVLLYVA